MSPGPRFESLGALLAVVLALPPAGPPGLRALGLALVLGVLPGWIVARHALPGWSAAGRAMLAVTLSPFLTAAPAALMVGAGVSVATAARIVTLAVAVLAAWEAWRWRAGFARRGTTPAPGERAERSDPTPWRVAASGVAAVLAFHLANPALARRSDAGFHAAVTLAVARAGVPPEDPYFAGLRLLYFWGSHVWAALWLGLAPGLAVWTPLFCLNLLATCGALLGVCLLARRLGGAPRTQWLAAALAAFGSAPFAWVWDAIRALSGEVRGVGELRRLLTHGVDPALGSMSFGLLQPSLVFAADKFMVVTPFSLGLALLPVFALCLAEVRGIPEPARPGARGAAAQGSPGGAAVTLGLVIGAALFVHPVVGMTLLGCGVAVALVGPPGPLLPTSGGRPGSNPAALVLALALPALALAPYLAAITAERRTGWALAPSWQALYSWLAGGALVVPAGMVWLWRGRSATARLLLTPALALTLGGLFGRLAGGNQSKLLSLLFLLLSAPAAIAWLALHDRLEARARAALAAALALAALPTAGLCAWAYGAERCQAPRDHHAPAPDALASLAWARAALPADAVLVGPAVEEGEATTLAVEARRPLLWGSATMAAKWGHAPEALALRRRAAEAIAAGAALSPADARFARGLGREIVVVEWRAPGEPRDDFARRAARPPGRLRLIHLGPDLAFSRYPVQP